MIEVTKFEITVLLHLRQKIMKNIFTAIICFCAFNLFAQDQPFIKQADTGMLPVFKENFRPQISIAPQVAYVSLSDLNSSGIGYGVELAMQCPLACTKKNYIRQQVSFLTYSDADLGYDYWTLSINPEYRLVVTPTFEWALGPSLGYINGSTADETSAGFAYGISTSATVHFGKFMLGISPRYVLAPDIQLEESELSQNSFQGIFKIGYKL